MDIKSTLKQLSETDGPSGREQAVAGLVSQLLEPLCDDMRTDEMFNVIGLKRGRGPEPRPQVMLMAHLDEIQMMVSALDGPFLRFVQLSYDPRVLVGQEVTVFGRRKLPGVIGDRPPHLMKPEDRRRMPDINDLVIDLGLDAETLAEFVQVGDVALIERSFSELLGERVAGKALDNRLSVTAMLATLDQLQRLQHPCDVLAVASVGEEFNGLGGGPAIKVADTGMITHPRLRRALVQIAEDHDIPYQLEVLPVGSTDAAAIQAARSGVIAGAVSVPCRYVHTPSEMVDMEDVENAVRLLTAFLSEALAEV